jgi:Helix-turn-helix domain
MTATEASTLYDVLEVEPDSSDEELRAAVERAQETYGPDSIAVYALVEESRLEGLRARLAQAAEVLLDPGRRASYDRSIGRLGPATLWTEDDEDEAPLPPVAPGPHARKAELALEAEQADQGDEPPRQQALGFELSDTPGPFGRGAERSETAVPVSDAPSTAPVGSAPLLHGDWAAAVASGRERNDARPPSTEAEAAPPVASPDPEAARAAPPAPLSAEVLEEPPRASAPVPKPAPPEREAAAASPPPLPGEKARPSRPARAGRGSLPPSLGLKVRPGGPPPVGSSASERPPELPARPREARIRLDLPSDVEFNGELLRRVRESYGLSLQQVAERTRITRIHLENVEADRYDRLPATVYLRGILVNLARELRLDPARVSKTYLLAAQRAHARAP